MIKTFKRGFTLIELTISMTIMIFIFSLALKSKNIMSKAINNIKSSATLSDIYDFLSYSKYYCSKNNVSIIINCRKKGYMEFSDPNLNFSKKIYLASGFKFITNYDISCNNDGTLSAETIYLCDNSDNFYKITISVGVDNINVYFEN